MASILPRTANPEVADAVHALLANFLEQLRTATGAWIFYSCDNNHYIGLRRYVPDYYRRDAMLAGVDCLTHAGLVIHERTRPSPLARYRSRLSATSILLNALAKVSGIGLHMPLRERIILRALKGRPTDYPESARTRQWRADVHKHNVFMNTVEIALVHPDVRHDGHILVVAGRRINPLRCCYYRVFNLCFDLGGRWYGHWVQQVPGSIRAGLRFNGVECIEIDIRACHLRLLCARAGAELGDGDPYDIAGLSRNEIKMAATIMINAPTWRSARGALCVELGPEHGRNAGSRANQLRAAIMSRYPLLEPFWNSGRACNCKARMRRYA